MSQRLENLESEFRTHHYALVDLNDDEKDMRKEQDILEHDDEMVTLATHVKQLMAACTSSPDSSLRKVAARRLSRLEKSVTSVRDAVHSMTGDRNVSLPCQYEESVTSRSSLGTFQTASCPWTWMNLMVSVRYRQG